MTYSYGICCGTIVSLEQIKIPENIEYKVYEVMRIIDGKILYFEDHMNRMELSLQFYVPGYQIDRDKIMGTIRMLIEKSNAKNDNIRIEGYLDAQNECHLIGFLLKGRYPDKTMYQEGVVVKTFNYMRKDPKVKSINHSYKKMLEGFIEKENIYEAILYYENEVTEGSRSNVFFIKDGKVYSTFSKNVLLGITRAKLIETLNQINVELVEENILKSELEKYEVAFLTGTSIHVLPIRIIDEIEYDINNPLLREIMKAFDMTVKSYLTI
ncbi:MAG: aminotransferase class IV [Clostridiales bacterium]|nr:aminotransferase class IV [Clostridiales bacterium]